MAIDDERNSYKKLESHECGCMRFDGDVSIFKVLNEAAESVCRGAVGAERFIKALCLQAAGPNTSK